MVVAVSTRTCLGRTVRVDWGFEGIAADNAVFGAGNMSWRLPFLTMLARSLNCSVFAPR